MRLGIFCFLWTEIKGLSKGKCGDMKLIIKNKFLLSVLAFTLHICIAKGQIDSTLKDFLPLSIGNYWQYELLFDQNQYIRWNETVIGDTVLPNGKKYFVMFHRDIPHKPTTDSYSFYRLGDSLQVMKYVGNTRLCLEEERIEYKLNTPDSSYWIACRRPDSSAYLRGLLGSHDEYFQIADKWLPTRTYCDVAIDSQSQKVIFSPLGSTVTLLTKGLGISQYSFEASGSAYLVGAVINGKRYGYITGIEEVESFTLKDALYQNFPNPFNPSTTILFFLPQTGFVTLKVIDILGREIATVAQGNYSAGLHNIEFKGDNLPSGVYLYRLIANNYTLTKKMLLVK